MLTRGKRLQQQQQEQHRTCPSPIICNIAIKQPELKKNQSKRQKKGPTTSFPKGSKTAGKVGKVASKIVRLVVGEDEEDTKSKADTKGFQAKFKLPEPASTVQNLQDDLSLISDEEDSVILIEPPIADMASQASTSNATRENANNSKAVNKRKKTDDDAGTKQRKINEYETSLTDSKIIADKFDIDRRTAENIVKFFEQDYTIPFIARYRKSDIGHLEANVLREVKDTYDEVLELRKRKTTVLKNLVKRNDEDLKKAIMDCTNIDELNSLYLPFASSRVNKLSQALENGLETVAMNILENKKEENLMSCVRPNVESISDIIKVEQAVVLILANHICSRPEILKFIDSEKRLDKFIVQSKRSKSPRTKVYPNLQHMKEERKYESYYNFTMKASKILPHQILALNRGKDNKMLSVLYTHADSFLDKFIGVCTKKWYIDWFTKRGKLLRQAIQYAYDKIVCPIIQKYVKATLKMKAEKCSINVFSNNLRQILLKAPIKGRPVLGIDPGFKNGCKMALISQSGSIVETAIIYPHVIASRRNMDDLTLQSMLLKYSCTLVALGNGKGCKETEMWLAHLIQANFFAPLEVKYAIVNESGSSIYSCSREAAEEFKKMDPCLISAVHLARRFQDPLLELVKVDPKHLGVGMYQHDLPESKLQKALDTVISECVSNVGVDLNTASLYLLKHVSGLTSARAASIIAYREANGLFKSREHLKKVRGIGEKTFVQCAGFLKIMESDIKNKLDSTIIHPESYDVTRNILQELNLTISDIGQKTFIAKAKSSTYRLCERYHEFGVSKESMKLILEALSEPLDYDFRGEFEIKPLMHKIVTSMKQLKVGHILEGRATNLTTFGCFVHVGCEKDGLIPSKELENVVLGIGDKIQVEVLSFDAFALRLSLRYLKHV
ncbi:PREDICTED: S1 RNA-binding domain-containing protein 1 isoform X2 [Nicrophorus vespilloides]|uniref:S1 RNA-binding domain-containing protein 1 isoform X2 n=1 Tax=Nicrophorus vespilloides TaxID=110193 RepID=A0ABM1MXH8_NICVS|nr:PREDICTED: S1 RNA-binding domain-containing protein 1 isoform X2 [Nicrophorus vespilloides]